MLIQEHGVSFVQTSDGLLSTSVDLDPLASEEEWTLTLPAT